MAVMKYRDGSGAVRDLLDATAHIHWVADNVGFYAFGKIGIVTVSFNAYTVGAWSNVKIADIPPGYHVAAGSTAPLGTVGKDGCWLQVNSNDEILVGCNAMALSNDTVWGCAVCILQ